MEEISNRTQSVSNTSKTHFGMICPCSRHHSYLQREQFSRIRKVFSLPTVHAADTPSATTNIEKAEKEQQGLSSAFISDLEVQEYIRSETGRDRLKLMFSKDHIGNLSPELKLVSDITTQAAGVTFLAMTYQSTRNVREDFIRENRATVYQSRIKAFRALQDAMFLRSIKEGVRWGVRISVYTASLLGVSQAIAVYRNKTSALEYAVGAGVTGALLKMNLGLKGMVSGSIVGAFLGLLGGLAILGVTKATNETQQQRHYWQIQKLLEVQKECKGLQDAMLETEGNQSSQPVAS